MPPSIRVLHVTNMYPTPDRPSFGIYVKRQIDALERLGLAQSLQVMPGGSSVRYMAAVGAIRARVASESFDVVHAHYGLSAWAAIWQPKPLVATFAGSDLYGHSNGREGKTWRGRCEVLLGNWAAWRAARVIVMTERMRDLVRSRVARRRTVVLPYGIPLNAFRSGSQDAARKRLGVPADNFVVLWPHSANPTKRRDMAERAVERLRHDVPHAMLWEPRVSPTEMEACYQAADCLLVTSDTEGSPNVVKEALCTALPVVSVDVGDVWRWTDRVDWCRRAERDPADIARRLVEVSRSGRPTEAPSFVGQFDCEHVARELVAVYESALSDRQAS